MHVTDAGSGGWVDDGTVVRLGTNTDKVGIGNNTPQGVLDIWSFVVVTADPYDAKIGSIHISGSASPENPPAGSCVLYFDGTDLYVKNSSGDTLAITSWGG